MKRITILLAALFVVYTASVCSVSAAVMNDYCVKPPFVSQVVPPLVMFETGRDHKFFYQAYNDAIDLDEDGQIDSKYKHSIQYYGYFDAFKCYTHSGGGGNTDKFTPVSITTDKFCGAGQWSGNVLNWLTMSRMDVLRKVLYGGQRNTDSGTATTLQRSFIPQDAHSWGKELTGRLCYDNGAGTYSYSCSTSADCKSGDTCVDKSNNLIGINAADPPSTCAASVTLPTYSTADKIFVARYQALDQNNNPRTGICGDYTYTYNSTTNQSTERDDIYLSYFNWNTVTDGPLNDTLNLLDYYYISDFDFYDGTTQKDANFQWNHADNFNFFAAAEFNVSNSDKGDWQFLLDGDDGVELLIDGVVKSIYPGCHSTCFQSASSSTYPPKDPASFVCTSGATPPTVATVSLTSGIHRLLVRHRDNSGVDGIRLWFRKTTSNTASWSVFGSAALGSGNLKAPAITASNVCSIKSVSFIGNGKPVVGTAKQHVFCNTTLDNNAPPLLRLSKNSPNRMWEWAARERPVCGTNFRVNGSDVAANPIDYTVQVDVCKAGMLEDNCKGYPIGSATPSSFKPVGLMQKYGDGDNTKFCSKTMSKTCTTDADCDLATEGLCMYKTGMYFGMASTSYTKNKSGGVLRKNFGSMLDEVNSNQGYVETSENVTGNIIHSFDRMTVIDFDYTGSNTPSYLAKCPFSAGAYGVFTEGTQCRMWGNPVGELMYETLRYIAGAKTSTTAFDYTTTSDSGVDLSHPAWGKFGTGSATYKPYDIFPPCAKPFLLALSDINTSYDDDQLPGTSFGTVSADPLLPSLNVTKLADTIGAVEGIDGKQFFIGETTSLIDYVCSNKAVSKLSLIRGICPEEPTKKGSFYAAAVAYYGKNSFRLDTNLPDVNTFVVALSSPVANLKIKAGSSYITMVPVGKSIHGGWTSTIHCLDRCGSSYIDKNVDGTVNKGVVLAGCTSGAINPTTEAGGAYCPSNQIVNTFVKDIRYDASNNVIYAKFSINYEDVEMGSDHDMDAIVDYEICTSASNGLSGTSCTSSLSGSQIEVKLNSTYSSGGVDQALGFVVSGTTADGLYLPVRDTDSSTLNNGYTTSGGNQIKLPTQWQKTFTTSSTAVAANFLKSPLWYAAKWGGFSDHNGNKIPDQRSEWAANCTETDISKCDPDNYFLVVNPLRLEQQLDKALSAILARTSSGTAASIVNKRQESGANLLTAIFYPQREFANSTMINWTGDLQNFWYYFDPLFTNSGLREDTIADNELRLKDDFAIDMNFDAKENKTMASRYRFDGKSTYSYVDSIDSDDLSALWRAGVELFNRTTTSRTVYTNLTTPNYLGNDYSANFTNLNTTIASTLMPYLQAPDATKASTIIDYTLGTDYSSLRNRTVNYKGTTSVWKLGDIVSSTPKIMSSNPINLYNYEYRDATYSDFIKSTNYRKRGTVFVGANDGMFHAFKLGTITNIAKGDKRASISGASLGSEQWAFVPRNALPYLGYLSDPAYDHIYSVDMTPTLLDASINPASCSSSNYWDCPRKTTVDSSVTVPKNVTESTPDNLVLTDTSWRTLVIGGMGQGGASRPANGTCSSTSTISTAVYPDCVKAPINVAGYYDVGMSSMFAMDVTDPLKPVLKWEFSRPDLGFATVEPAIVRINGKTAGKVDPNTNGRWFAIFASGPTGPIQTLSHQFYGRSDQTLRIFVVDLVTGKLVRTFNTGDTTDSNIILGTSGADLKVANAFGGPLFTNHIDTDVDDLIDRYDATNPGFFSTDAVYISYTRAKIDSKDNKYKWDITATGGGSTGGLLRLSTHEDIDPNNWTLSTLIDGTGPITSSIDRMYDRKDPETGKPKLWLYFGAGRYFYKDSVIDDADTRQSVYGIKEPCYVQRTKTDGSGEKFWGIDPGCTASLSRSDLTDSSTVLATYPTGNKGWFIDLENTDSSFKAERSITTPIHRTSGLVVFTTFKPTANICSYGGETGQYLVNYSNGGLPPHGSLKGVITIQLSTGAIIKVDLSKISITGDGYGIALSGGVVGGRPLRIDLGLGKPPTPPPQDDRPKKPVQKILHIQER